MHIQSTQGVRVHPMYVYIYIYMHMYIYMYIYIQVYIRTDMACMM